MSARHIIGMLLVLAPVVMGQNEEKVKFDAQIRGRSEYDNRDFNSKTKYNTYDLLRTRLGVTLMPIDNLKAYIQIQDSRVYGKEPSTLADTRNVDMHQAYIEYKGFLWSRWDIKIGRMELSYGDERLIGAVGWSNVGRSFDAEVNRFNFTKKTRLDLVVARLEEASTPPAVADPKLQTVPSDKNDRFLNVLYLMTEPSENLKTDVYVISQTDNARIQPPSADSGKRELNQVTTGVYLHGNAGKLAYKAETAFQTGKTAGRTTSAYLLSGALEYTFMEEGVKPQLIVAYDHLSGDDNPGDSKYNAFSNLFGTNHKFYGYMDYFIDVPAQTGNLGLRDVMIKGRLLPFDRATLALDYHYFMSAEKGAGGSKIFGQEFDFVGTYKFNKHLSFELGVSLFLPGKLMKAAFGTDDPGVWSYSAITFSM